MATITVNQILLKRLTSTTILSTALSIGETAVVKDGTSYKLYVGTDGTVMGNKPLTVDLTLDQLTNVVTSGAQLGEVLTFNGNNWEPQTIATTLAGLTDVNLTTLSNGQGIKYDLTTQKWINYTIPTSMDASNITFTSTTGITSTNVESALDELNVDKMNLVDSATNGNIATLNGDGQVIDSGISFVTTISNGGNDTHVPTEKAVVDAIDAAVQNATNNGVSGTGSAGQAAVWVNGSTITNLGIDTTSGGTSSSSNLITSGAVYSGLTGKANAISTGQGTGTKVTVNSQGIVTAITDTTISDVTGLQTALNGKQNQLSGTDGNVLTYTSTAGSIGSLAIDTTTTANSSNLITSGAVAASISQLAEEGVVFKGIVANQTLLPANGNINGDLYWITEFVTPLPSGITEGNSGAAIYRGTEGSDGAFEYSEDRIYHPDGITINLGGSGGTLAIMDSSVTNTKLSNMGSYTVKGNNSGSSGSPQDVTIEALAGSLKLSSAAGSNPLQSQIAAGTNGNVLTYTGTAGTVGTIGVDTTVTDSSSNLITSNAVNDFVVDYVENNVAINAGTGISITGSAPKVVNIVAPSGTNIGGVKAGTNVTITTDGTISVASASQTISGIIQQATDAQVTTGTNTTTAVSPAQVTNKINAILPNQTSFTSGLYKITTNAKGQVTTTTAAGVNDLSDVTITNVTTNNVLVYNGSAWVNDIITVIVDGGGAWA